MFNALKYTEELEKAGFTREQAEASVKLVVETMNENFATKSDLKELGWLLQSEMKTFANHFESEMKTLANNFDAKIHALDSKIDSKIHALDSKIDSKIQVLDTKIDSKFQALDTKIDSKVQSLESNIKEMEYKLTIKLGTLMALSIGITATLVKLLPSAGH